jgi:voltage-gated potassium channel
MQLLLELAAATAMVAATVTAHLAGLAALLALLRRHREGRPDRRGLIAEGLAIVAAAAGLFVLHGIEIWAYAALYLGVGAVGNLETALYFSTASYTTVGYGDVVLDPRWRVVGAIESANGIILLGWSTAFFVSIVGRIRWLEAEAQELS